MLSFSDLFLLFLIYSIFGWICETIYCSIGAKKLVPRGFLKGPYCPIYGFGALLILLPLEPLRASPALVFLCGLLITTALEYATSWLMEKLFHVRWWDYSKKKLNLNGRICLQNSLMFGAMGIIMVYFIHPRVLDLLALIPNDSERVVASVLFALLVIDFLSTMNSMIGFEEKLQQLKELTQELRVSNERFSWYDSSDLSGSIERLKALGEKAGVPSSRVKTLEAIASLPANIKRLLKAYPNMRHSHLGESLNTLRSTLKARGEATKEKWTSRAKSFFKRAGIIIHEKAVQPEPAESSFASGVSFYKIIWIFFVSSIIGYVLETLFCLVTNGYIESRQGVIYGPFCQVYGFGAVVMVLALHKLAHLNDRWIFLASAVIGGVFEYICSLVQELAFKSISWEYSDQVGSIGGRTSLLYTLFWGILGVVLIKNIYPAMSRQIEKIPNRQGVFFTWIIIILMVFDLGISGLAVTRWAARDEGVPASNEFEEFLDEHYNDDFLREIYPNMQFVKSGS